MATIVFRIALHSILSPQREQHFRGGIIRRSNIVRGKLTVRRQNRDKQGCLSWRPLSLKASVTALQHDPEKWAPVFRKDHTQQKDRARWRFDEKPSRSRERAAASGN